MVMIIMLYKVVLTFDETLNWNPSNESYWAVLSCGAAYYDAQSVKNMLIVCSTFLLSGWNLKSCDLVLKSLKVYKNIIKSTILAFSCFWRRFFNIFNDLSSLMSYQGLSIRWPQGNPSCSWKKISQTISLLISALPGCPEIAITHSNFRLENKLFSGLRPLEGSFSLFPGRYPTHRPLSCLLSVCSLLQWTNPKVWPFLWNLLRLTCYSDDYNVVQSGFNFRWNP